MVFAAGGTEIRFDGIEVLFAGAVFCFGDFSSDFFELGYIPSENC